MLDFAVGPVRLSGLFTLLKDFGIITGSTKYSIPGWNNDKTFYKREFLSLLLKDEVGNIELFQKLLEEAEARIKAEKQSLIVNDINEALEVPEEEDFGDMMRAIEGE